MRSPGRSAATLLASVAISCGGAGSSGQSGSADTVASTSPAQAGGETPEVEPRFQERINRAWSQAVAGENPSATCAGVKGRAAAAQPGLADRALAACNLDIPLRYFLAVVDRVRAGELNCRQLMVQVTTQLPAMTVSTESFSALAREGSDTEGGTAAGAAAAMLTGEAAAGGGVGDARQSVKDRLRAPVNEVCPAEAGLILR